MIRHAVILAGGSGTRLWPASTQKHPKQLLELVQGQSLFAMTLQRAVGLGIEGFICVVTHRDHAQAIARECENVLKERRFPLGRVLVLPEPESRNTAPAIAFAAAVLQKAGSPADTLLVMPADHTISPLTVFAEDVDRAAVLAEKSWLVTFGIPPASPETGYGYVESAGPLPGGFEVGKFKEKPDAETARLFIEQGNHYWNSGMFAFRIDTFLEELDKHSPEVAAGFRSLALPEIPAAASAGHPLSFPAGEAIEQVYRAVPSISVDYAVMEHSRRSAVVPARFAWSDVGSWDVVAEMFASQTASGSGQQVVSVEAEGNFVFSDIPVALAGVQDLVVVVKNGVLLICRKGRTQLVRDVVQRLKNSNDQELL